MANAKILEQKKQVVQEIKDKFENASSVVVFDYRGLTVSEVTELRKKLRESNSSFKVYKNTLTKRAINELNIDLDSHFEGPSAISFSNDALAPVKVLSEFAKKHTALELKVGLIDGKISDVNELKKLATIPARETLLTMLAGGMMSSVRNLSICLNMYSEKMDNKN